MDLRILDLSDNTVASELPDLTDSSLVWVNLTGNGMTGRLPSDFNSAKDTLVMLSLSGNNLGGGGSPQRKRM